MNLEVRLSVLASENSGNGGLYLGSLCLCFGWKPLKEISCGKSQGSPCLLPGLSDYCPLFPNVHLFLQTIVLYILTVLVVLGRRKI